MSTEMQQASLVWRTGKQVILRPFLDSDLFQFLQWINNPENTQYLFVTWPMHEAGQREWFAQATKSDPSRIRAAICTHEGKLIGNIGMDINFEKQSATTGTLIGLPEYQNKGYGTDAKMLLLDYAFNWCGLRKVTSNIISFNGRSQAYAKKCGYRHMATIEQEYFRNGAWQDEEQYVVFREEWIPFWKEYCQSSE